MYIVSTQQMQAAEKVADASGLSYAQLMENAGRAVAEAVEQFVDGIDGHVLVLVGPGNNGGDGLVVARYLAGKGIAVTAYIWKRELDDDPNWALLNQTDVERIIGNDAAGHNRLAHLLDETDLIVDALLGTGVSRSIEGSLAALLEQTRTAVMARRAKGRNLNLIEPARPQFDDDPLPYVVAVDLPSGLNSDTGAVDPYTLAADTTVTLAAVKKGHILSPGPDVVGRLIVGDIGLTPDCYADDVTLEMATAGSVTEMLPTRSKTAHKGTFGTALIVAGAIDYTGAAILCGQAAVQSGAGLVTLAVPQLIHPIAAAAIREATYCPLPHSNGFISPAAVAPVQAKLAKASALLVGPGLGLNDSTVGFVSDLLASSEALPPLVIDADALNILAQQEAWWNLLPEGCILTPHPGEMSRLRGTTIEAVQADRLEVAKTMAMQSKQIILLKGAHTIVAAPDGRSMVLPFANPALAKAGSGDVLAGIIVGLRAQGLAAFEAAVAGAYLHGLAGEYARESIGATGVAAGDVVAFVPSAFQDLTGI